MHQESRHHGRAHSREETASYREHSEKLKGANCFGTAGQFVTRRATRFLSPLR